MEENVFNKLDIVISNLNELDYTYKRIDNSIEINLGFGLTSKIILENSKMKILGILKPWNPITGFVKMEIEKSLKMNSILLLITAVILFLGFIDGFPPTIFIYCLFQLVTVYMTIWYIYYIIKFYIFKYEIESWITNSK
ncbi:hypothetical protein PFY12_10410 [Chryseobacterium camelliae]|uniref:Uncharacterized protein n=1 Tax=Chryseobacterium camelliae TaxID=1265445 RepID=A0ABY7QIM5_9FLAO|nr:hypothetical protein [Chryseobacterium camelliae]WBV59470.1 hypothetical protein PFY12_10410 [Chryseobacterium camelliae]